MKKKIIILGSTGSIGKTTFQIIQKNSSEFNVVLLTTNKNISEIINQARSLNVKNIIVTSRDHYLKLKKNNKNKKLKIYNNFDVINKIFKKKEIDYCMSAITGLNGLKPTLDTIKLSKTIAIANKESIICGWNLIEKKLKKYKTNFIPVDSEHFSIWSVIKNFKNDDIEEIILTASGGPFLNKPLKFIKNANPLRATKHPNWKMGKKISIDSATLINKVFEIIEAQRIFKINKSKFKILIHPKSYIHAIVKFKNGLIKIVAHETSMKIPIFNSIYYDANKHIETNKINLEVLNNLNLSNPDLKKFPSLKLLKKINNNVSLYETVLISANDELVDQYLKKKIKFFDIFNNLLQILNNKNFRVFKRKKPNNVDQIIKLNKQVRLKTLNLCIK
tara:strand:+ start:614 stop:1783 length:1170 start_codon:yes stop_codon:yes gene_type:complete